MNTGIIRLESKSDATRWMEVLDACGNYDVYHTAEYHLVAKDEGRGEPVLLVASSAAGVTAFPLLLQRGQGADDQLLLDAVSVYGYGGPVTSLPGGITGRQFAWQHGATLLELMRELRLVSVFTRMHPLLDTAWVFTDIGRVQHMGKTVVIDLHCALDEQRKALRKGHRYSIKKAREAGVRVELDESWAGLDEFLVAYSETMMRVDAADSYSFRRAEFLNLRTRLGDRIKLFHAVFDNQIVASSIFFACNGILQYHLGATSNDWIRLSPGLAILDEVRVWGMDHGFRWLHLGGGVQGRDDAVFRFKSGLSKTFLDSSWAAVVVDEPRYHQLAQLRALELGGTAEADLQADFFPLYRASLRYSET